jgi:RNA polymerase sigma-70 factor (ECF subfamily)
MTLQEFNHRMLGLQESLQYYAYSLTSSQDDAMDLLQDTFFKALSNKDKFDPATNMKAWAYTIMKNTFINNYRKARRANTVIDDSQDLYYINSNQKTVSISPDSEFNHGEIMKTIRSLDDDQRIPFEMHIEGYKYKEIAEDMNLPIGTVKSRIFLTRKKLSEKLKDYQN